MGTEIKKINEPPSHYVYQTLLTRLNDGRQSKTQITTMNLRFLFFRSLTTVMIQTVHISLMNCSLWTITNSGTCSLAAALSVLLLKVLIPRWCRQIGHTDQFHPLSSSESLLHTSRMTKVETSACFFHCFFISGLAILLLLWMLWYFIPQLHLCCFQKTDEEPASRLLFELLGRSESAVW